MQQVNCTVTTITTISLRSGLWLAFFAAVLASWWVLFSMSGQMGLNWYGVRAGTMNMAAMSPMESFRFLFPMWAVMMVAMMGPTFVTTLNAYEDLIVSANGSRIGGLGLILGYFTVWFGFAALIAGLQQVLTVFGYLDMLGRSSLLWVSALLLVVVGGFQFTWVKQVCHGVCHAPMMYFLGNWRTGFTGGLRMGLGLGSYCVFCCWGFMVLGFVGGTMNLLWMGLATFLMTLEKLPQVAHYVVRPLGVALIGAGIVLGVFASRYL